MGHLRTQMDQTIFWMHCKNSTSKIFRKYCLPKVSTGQARKFTCATHVNYPSISLMHYYSVVKITKGQYLLFLL